jgi:transposase
MKEGFEIIFPDCAGIDLGASEFYVCAGPEEVKQFGTFTSDLQSICEYLQSKKIKSVVMEATGVLWMPIYDMLEQGGMKVYLVNSAHIKFLPGRKSDVRDCQWLQKLQSCGLLRASFIPDEQTRELRTYMRLRKDHIQMGSTHIQHIQRALELMNIKLHREIAQITGASGLRVVEAIISGCHDPQALVKLCDKRILKEKKALVIESLRGNFRSEYIFLLSQAVKGWKFYQDQIQECDKEVERLLKKITRDLPAPEQIGPPKPSRHNSPDIDDLHMHVLKMTAGKDPTPIPGISDLLALRILSETGHNMSYWKNEKHFTAWMGLAPKRNQSGKNRRKIPLKGNQFLCQLFKDAAFSVSKMKNHVLGLFYRRVKSNRGPLIAIKSTARKIAEQFYWVLSGKHKYFAQTTEQYMEVFRENQRKKLQKKAISLGFELIPVVK